MISKGDEEFLTILIIFFYSFELEMKVFYIIILFMIFKDYNFKILNSFFKKIKFWNRINYCFCYNINFYQIYILITVL